MATTRAPKGGTRAGGKFYRGGQVLPAKYRAQTQQSTRALDPAIFVPEMPPNFGRANIPHIISFSGMQTTLSRSYRHADEAMRDSVQNAHMMLNDPQITEPLFARMRQTALFRWHIEPGDQKDKEQVALAQKVGNIIEKTPYFTMYRWAALLSLWYGRYGIEHQLTRGRDSDGQKHFYVNKWTPVSGDKLVFRYDDGRYEYDPEQVGVRVSPALAPRDILGGERRLEPTADGLAYFLEPWERNAWLVHRHLRMDGEYEDPLSGGKIHGVGLRSFVYWIWLIKQEALSQLTEIVERTARGFTIYWYPTGNDKAKQEVAKIAEEQAHQNVILMPKDAETEQYGIDVVPPETAGLQALQDLISNHYGHLMKRLILGQTLSSEADATGMGSGVADAHMDTLYQIAKFDSINLEETITREMVRPIQSYSFPRYRDVDLYFKIDTDSAQPEKELESAFKVWQMGGRIKEAELMDKVGLSVPDAEDSVLQNPQILQQMRLAEQAMNQGQFSGQNSMSDWLSGGIGPEVEGGPQQMDMEGGTPKSSTDRGGDAGRADGGTARTFGPIMESKIAGAKPGLWPQKYAATDWVQRTGDRGGTYWENMTTGETRYQTERPGDNEPAAADAQGGDSPGKPEAADEPPTIDNAPATAWQFGYEGGDPHSFVTKTARRLGYDPAGDTKEERGMNAAKYLDQTHAGLSSIVDAGSALGFKPKSKIASTNAIHSARHIISKAEEAGYKRSGDAVKDLHGAAEHLQKAVGKQASPQKPEWLEHAEKFGPALLGIAATALGKKSPLLAALLPVAMVALKEYGKQFDDATSQEKNAAISQALRDMGDRIGFQPKLGPVAQPKTQKPTKPTAGKPTKPTAKQEPKKTAPKPKADEVYGVQVRETTAADVADQQAPEPKHDPRAAFASLSKEQAGQDVASKGKTLGEFFKQGVEKGWDEQRFKSFAPKTTEAIEKAYGQDITKAIDDWQYEKPKQRQTQKVKEEAFNQQVSDWLEGTAADEGDHELLANAVRDLVDQHNEGVQTRNSWRQSMASAFFSNNPAAMQQKIRSKEDAASIRNLDLAVQMTESSYEHVLAHAPHEFRNDQSEDKVRAMLEMPFEKEAELTDEGFFQSAYDALGFMEAASMGDIPVEQDPTPEEKYGDEEGSDEAPWYENRHRRAGYDGKTGTMPPLENYDDEGDDDFNFGANAIEDEDEEVPFAKGAAIHRRLYRKAITRGDAVSAEIAREAFNAASLEVAKYASRRVGRRRTKGIVDAPGQSLMDFADTARNVPDPYDTAKHPKDARGKFAPTKPAKSSSDQQLGIWTQYIGPTGANGWQNMATGEVRYQDKMPSSRGKGEDDPATPQPKAEELPKPEGIDAARLERMSKHPGSVETFAKALEQEGHDDPDIKDGGSGFQHDLLSIIQSGPKCGKEGCDPPEASTGREIELDDLETYDKFLVQFSGGKDSMACVLDLLDRGVPPEKIELWHQKIDGGNRHFMDWPVTEDYCRKIADHLGLPLFFQWREGGFEGELTKQDAKSGGYYYETGDGRVEYVPMGDRAEEDTRRKYPAQGCNLNTRWCSAYLKIDVAERAINNDPRYATKRGGKGAKFMFVSGERAEEGGRRDKYPEAELHGTNNKTRTMHHWRNVHKWSEQQVWDKMKEHGIMPHPAYRLGYGRLSCQHCIFADKNQVASNLELDPQGVQRIADYEDDFGHYINSGAWKVGNEYFETKKAAIEFIEEEGIDRDQLERMEKPDPNRPGKMKGTTKGYSILKKAAAGTSFVRDKPAELKQQAMAEEYAMPVYINPSEWQIPDGAFKRAGGPGHMERKPDKHAKGFPTIVEALTDWYGNIPGGEKVIEKYKHLD